MAATFLYRRPDHLAEERFRDETGFRMVPGRRRQRTPVAANEMFALALLEARGATEVGKDAERGVDSLLPGLASHFRQMLARYFAAYLPHPRLQFSRAQLLGEHREDQIHEGAVSFRENLFRVGGESISCMRFTDARLGAGLVHEAIAFQAKEVGADRVISEL